MKYNKGFASATILLIILGVLVVSGVAYFAGKNSAPKNEVADNSNYFPTTNNTNSTQTSPSNNTSQQNTQTQQQVGCNSNSSPSVKIISPNGGETYQAGGNIQLKWRTCNIPQNAIFSLMTLVNTSNNSYVMWEAGGEAGWAGMPSPLNDGVEVIALDTTGSDPVIVVPPGTYKACMKGVWIGSTPPGLGVNVNDCSDNFFTIN